MGAIMTNVVRLGFKAPESLVPLLELDRLSDKAQSAVDKRNHIRSLLAIEPKSLREADMWISELQALAPSRQEIGELETRITNGLEPATPQQIQEQLGLLVGAFPSSNAPDPIVYSRMLLIEVAAAAPSLLALIAACAQLRRTRQWPPSASDVLAAIRDEEVRWRQRLSCGSEMVEAHAKALKQLLAKRAWLARSDEETEAQRKDRLQRLQGLKRLLRVKGVEN